MGEGTECEGGVADVGEGRRGRGEGWAEGDEREKGKRRGKERQRGRRGVKEGGKR